MTKNPPEYFRLNHTQPSVAHAYREIALIAPESIPPAVVKEARALEWFYGNRPPRSSSFTEEARAAWAREQATAAKTAKPNVLDLSTVAAAEVLDAEAERLRLAWDLAWSVASEDAVTTVRAHAEEWQERLLPTFLAAWDDFRVADGWYRGSIYYDHAEILRLGLTDEYNAALTGANIVGTVLKGWSAISGEKHGELAWLDAPIGFVISADPGTAPQDLAVRAGALLKAGIAGSEVPA
ncbi:MAG: hypothetical protein KDC23_01495 [Actinobacteria bacterium]|nr:hypothetical protein [Actinomycetota bacterium]